MLRENYTIYYLIALALFFYVGIKNLAAFYEDVDWKNSKDVIAYSLYVAFSFGLLAYVTFSFITNRRLAETFLREGPRKIEFSRTWPLRFAFFGALFFVFSANLILHSVLEWAFSYLFWTAVFVLLLSFYFLAVAMRGWRIRTFISFRGNGLDISGVGFVAWPQVERISLSYTAIAICFKKNALFYHPVPKWKSFICGYSTYENDNVMVVYMSHMWRLKIPSMITLLFKKEYAVYLGHQIFESDHEEELIERAIAERGKIVFDNVPYHNVLAVKDTSFG